MKTWQTDKGRTVSAATRTAAEQLAAEYGMGRIIALTSPATPTNSSTLIFIAWDQLCEAERCRGSLEHVAEYFCTDPDNTLTLMVQPIGRPMRRPTPAEWRQFEALV